MKKKSLTENYGKEKEKLLSIFSDIKESEVINIISNLNKQVAVQHKKNHTIINKDDISTSMENLKDEKFTISICGQIKAGKSTLLNNLFFDGDDILPTDDTVCTASLSCIQYGKERCAKVSYYNQDEWEKLQHTKVSETKNYYEKFLKDELNKLVNDHGIYPKKVVKTKRIVKEIGLNELKNYISKDGKYSIFVKKVDLFINDDRVKDILVVDTPGLNDPNIVRSQKTLDFIKSSTAVIMLFYAQNPLSRNDLEFIDEYLAYINSEKILFCVNKIDMIEEEEYGPIKNYIEVNIENNKEIKDRNLLKGDREVYPISTLAYQLAYKRKNNIELNEDDKFFLEKILKNDKSLLEKEGNLDDLINAVNKYIMEGKGEAILKKNIQLIRTIFQKGIRYAEIIKNRLENEKNNSLKSVEEIEKEINKIIKLIRDLDKLINKYQNELNSLEVKFANNLKEKIDDLCKESGDDINKWIDEASIEEVIGLTPWNLTAKLEERLSNITNFFGNEEKKEIEDIIRKYKSYFKDKAKLIFNTEYFDVLLPEINIDELTKPLSYISTTDLEPLRIRFLLWTKKDQTKINIKGKITKRLHAVKDKLNGNVNEIIDNEIIKNLRSYADDLALESKFHKEKLGKIKKEKSKKEEYVNNYDGKINVITKNLERLQEKKEDINSRLEDINI